MTTAHRPTWAPARGGEEQGGNRMFVPSLMRSSKDATAHTKLKLRQDGQGATGADLKVRDVLVLAAFFLLFSSSGLQQRLSPPAPLSFHPNTTHNRRSCCARSARRRPRSRASSSKVRRR